MTRIADFPVVADAADATGRVQAAIDEAHAAGGGRVVLEAGVHRCRGLVLRSHVDLHLALGAVLLPEPDYDAYLETTVRVIAEDSDRAMIVARGARGIAITGMGTIEAGGASFIAGDDPVMGTWTPARLRPRVIVLDECTDVRLEGFSVRASPMWTIHAIACRNLTARGVRVDNDRRMPNTDGFVVDSCEDVLIEHMEIRTADDGIVLKTTAGPDGVPIGPCRRVRVVKCLIESRSCALKIGTETHSPVSDIVFEDCEIVASNRGLGVFSRDGGDVTNVRFSRIVLDCEETPDGFWGSGEALTVTVVDRRPDRPAGSVSGLVAEDISGSMAGAINFVAHAPGRICGAQLRRIFLAQRPGPYGTALRYDLRPTAADLAPPPDGSGRANAWVKDAGGRVVGLVPYPGGMPGVFLKNVADVEEEDVVVERPDILPRQWNSKRVVRE
ncbi:polygalacturonase PglB [Pelagibacterium xiamenense]|uniref:polygalacturonase PglB n=1 Tax=Pelagibacterium xiamenense TaxID=2901140 RepID=UPI001E3B914A|nr:glycoside hydrolase family 28 protein [Pelagibacterium xiamenense]